MRSALALAIFIGFVAAACSSELVARPPPPPVNWRSLEVRPPLPDAGPTSATRKERAAGDAYLKALESPGFAELGRLLDEDVHFAFAGSKDVHGRENAIHMHDVLLGAFDSRRFVTTRGLLTDSAQVIEWTMTGVHRASHKRVALRGLTLLSTKDDGSLVDIRLYFDEALVNAQLGVGPRGLIDLPPPPTPTAAPQEVQQVHSAEESANAAVVRDSLEAFENKAALAYLATMSEDVEVTTLEAAKPARGKTDALGYFKAMHKAIAQLDTGIDNIWGIGSFVVVEYHIVGEQRGPLGFIPAQKDNLFKMFVVDVVELQGGKIARVWRFDNPRQILLAP